ncbi:MAG TPA: nuclear transport factor 2 family protein [Acidimicrobiales bacterium]|nr:nuclear transport factor 2 family protein [Acidimicrobiales bacterium]
MDREETRALIRRYTAAWAASDIDAWLSTFALGATQEDPVGEGVRRGWEEIAGFWEQAMSSYDSIEIRERAIHMLDREAALEWTIVARDGDEWVTFDGVDTFVFDHEPLITAVRAFWDRNARTRTAHRP